MTGPTAWNKISGIKALRLADTKEMPKEDWLRMRRLGIGGSDISAIAGVNPWKSAIDVFLEKTGASKGPEENERMLWGTYLESPVAEHFSRTKKLTINRCNAILQHPDVPHFLANIDRLILEPDPIAQELLGVAGNGILEVKTTSWAQAWAGDDIPDMYMCQLQWYLGVTGLSWGAFAALITGNTFTDRTPVLKDVAFVENLMLIADKFWTQNVKKGIPPTPQSEACLDAVKLLYPDTADSTCELAPELNELLVRRARLVQAEKDAKSAKAEIDAHILFNMKENRWGVSEDFKVTKVSRATLRLQEKQFKEAYPDLWRQFSKESKSTYILVKSLT